MTSIDLYVRYCETDASGHVNNTSYFVYMEEARTKFFASIGFGPSERENLNFILARTECDYITQAYAGQTLIVETMVSRIGTKSYTMKHKIKDSKTGVVVASGEAVVVCFDYKTQQSIAIPEQLRNRLEEYLLIYK